MDTPVTRTKQQIINFYAGVLREQFELTDSQEDAVEAALAFACSEMAEKSTQALAKLHDQWAEANNEVVRLKKANEDAEEEIGRLCTELQELKAKRVAIIQMNGTAPTHETAEPPAMPQQLEPATPSAAAAPRRGGRKPGAKNKPKETPKLTLDEIAKQIEVGTVPQLATIDRSLINDDPNVVALHGTLRREESHVTTQHGMPVRVTRRYVELR